MTSQHQTNSSPIVCSRAGCQLDAVSKINWRNPKIHGPDRTKTWLACQDHLDYLINYLSSRDFYLDTEKLK
jgi:hypothetical protein